MISEFHLPRSREIPNIGLFLEQTVRYLNGTLAPLGEEEITPSMVSNYVKAGLLPKPEKKLYYPTHIRILFYIATMKNVVSLEDAALFSGMSEEDYDSFCKKFEETLFTFAPAEREMGAVTKDEIADAMIASAVSKIILDRTVADYRATLPPKEEKKEKKEKKKK